MISTHEERCLNRRHRTEFCHICRDTCPQNAIDISDLTIRIDTMQCDLCALCIADCPTEVFTHDAFSPLAFLEQAKGSQTLDLRCKLMDNREAGPRHMRIPCHGLLDDRLLTGLHAVGVEHLHLHGINECKSCPSRVGSIRLSKILEKASPELQRHFPFIHTDCHEDADPPQTAMTQNKPRAETPINRRNFLGRMADTSTQTVVFAAMGSLPFNLAEENTAETPGKPPALDQNEYKTKHVPQRHHLALFNLASVQTSASASTRACSWFHEIHPQGVCDACSICALHCPTGALLIKNSGQELDLQHHAAACIGCGLCVSLCPTQALRLDTVNNGTLIAGDQITALFRCHQSICASCGQSFTYSGEITNMCSSCENEKCIEHDIFGQGGHFQPVKPGH